MMKLSTNQKIIAGVVAAAGAYLIYSFVAEKKAAASTGGGGALPGGGGALPAGGGAKNVNFTPGPSPSQSAGGDVCLKESGGALGTYQVQALLTALSQRWGDASMNPKGVDGTMGNNTRSAIKGFQKAGDQPQTGTFDPATAANLKDIWSKYGGPSIILPRNPSSNDVKTVAVLNNLRAAWGVAGSGGGSA